MPLQTTEDVLKLVESYNNPPNRLRSVQEITACYNRALETYKKICFMSGDVRDQKIATHAEIKALGWVLGKPEKDIIKDITANSNRPNFPLQLPR